MEEAWDARSETYTIGEVFDQILYLNVSCFELVVQPKEQSAPDTAFAFMRMLEASCGVDNG